MEVGQNISTYPKSKKHTYYFVPDTKSLLIFFINLILNISSSWVVINVAAGKYKIVLYMSRRTPKYHQVLNNIKKCLKNLNLNMEIEEVDLQKNPERALRDGVLTTPTLDLVGLNWRFIGVPTVDELTEVLEDLKKRKEDE